MNNICIFAPMGGFGQHVRWMALLDRQFRIGDYVRTSEKVEYILGTVYNNRTASNWIDNEKKYSAGLNDLIYFNHQLDKENRIVRLKNQHNQRFFAYSEETKFLCCTCNPRIALKSYRALKPNLNDWSREQFLERVEIDNMLALTTPLYHDNTVIINNDILYGSEILNREYYNKLANHLQLDNNYKAAAAIHIKWWGLHRKAEENNSA